jgi:hypothetical protein
MENYAIYCGNKVIGFVSAINGDLAWLLATITQPIATHLKMLA